MIVYVLTYFYPDGSFAGVFAVTTSEHGAEAVKRAAQAVDYPDCTFVITRSEVTN